MAFRLRFSISACRWLERDDCRLHVVPASPDVIEEFGSAAATQNRAFLSVTKDDAAGLGTERWPLLFNGVLKVRNLRVSESAVTAQK